MLDPKWSIYITRLPPKTQQSSWKMGQREPEVREDCCETLPGMIGQLHTWIHNGFGNIPKTYVKILA